MRQRRDSHAFGLRKDRCVVQRPTAEEGYPEKVFFFGLKNKLILLVLPLLLFFCFLFFCFFFRTNAGILKKHMPRVYEAVIQKFTFYFAGQHPSLSLTSPNKDACSSPALAGGDKHGHLKLHLISAQDGRESVVDLTRTLAEMSQRGKISPRDISMELVDAELSEGIMPEPDLLILFSPNVELSGYPPWQIRLTEIFCLQDNQEFGYQVFLKALRKFAKAQMRRGK